MQVSGIKQGRQNVSFKGFLNNNLLVKGIGMASNNGVLFGSALSLALSAVIRPLVVMSTPKVEKENNGGNGNGNGGNNNTNAISDAVANISIYAYNRTIVVENANADIAIFDVNGRMVAKRTANNSRIEMQLPKSGLYIVKVGDTSQKVVLK